MHAKSWRQVAAPKLCIAGSCTGRCKHVAARRASPRLVLVNIGFLFRRCEYKTAEILLQHLLVVDLVRCSCHSRFAEDCEVQFDYLHVAICLKPSNRLTWQRHSLSLAVQGGYAKIMLIQPFWYNRSTQAIADARESMGFANKQVLQHLHRSVASKDGLLMYA